MKSRIVNQLLFSAFIGQLVVSTGTMLPANADPVDGGYSVIHSDAPGDLSIGAGSTVVVDLSAAGDVHIVGDLSIAGTVYAISTNPSVSSGSINAGNISIANGGMLTSVLPAGGLPGFANALSNFSLVLNSAGNVYNAGNISSAANLSVFAGNAITNSGVMSAQGNLGLNAASSVSNIVNSSMTAGILQAVNSISVVSPNVVNTAQITSVTSNISIITNILQNSGVVQSLAGNIGIEALAKAALNIDNNSGTIKALAGSIAIDAASGETLQLLGGKLLAGGAVNLTADCGNINVFADQISGTVNASAATAYIGTNSADLQMGNLTLSKDPIFFNNGGNIDITGTIVTGGGDLGIFAAGDITLSPLVGEIFDTSSTNGGGDIYLVAGATTTKIGLPPFGGTGGTAPVAGAPDGTYEVTLTGGGNILLSNNAPLTPGKFSIDTRGTAAGKSGGNVTMIAAAAGAGTGQVTFGPNTGREMNTSGSGAGANGNVLIIAGFNPAVVTDGVRLTKITTDGGTGGGGAISIYTSQPITQGGPATFTLANSGADINLVSGSFAPSGGFGTPVLNPNASVTFFSFATNGGGIEIQAGNAVTFNFLFTDCLTGNAGSVNITSATSSIDSRFIRAQAGFTGAGTGGSINLTAATTISTGEMFTGASNNNAGNITLDSAIAAFTVGGLNVASSNNLPGNITFKQSGVTLTNPVVAFETNSNIISSGRSATALPTITLQLANANPLSSIYLVNTGTGDSGSISLTSASDVTVTGSLQADSSSNNGGNISIVTTGGSINILTPAIQVHTGTGKAGKVTLSATGDITTRNIQAYVFTSPSPNSGGNVTLTSSGGNVSTGVIDTHANLGNAGSVTIDAAGSISVGDLNLQSVFGTGGNLSMDSKINSYSMSSINVSSQTNAAGAVSFTQSAAPLASPSVSFTAGSNLFAFGTSATSTPSLSFALANANSLNRIETRNSGTGNSGNVTLTSGTDITVTSRVDTSSQGGNGGKIDISTTAGAITLLGLQSGAGTAGSAGSVSVSATGAVMASQFIQASSSPLGNGGDITVNSTGGPITLAGVSAAGAVQGGNISIDAGGDINISSVVSSRGGTGSGGSITFDSGSAVFNLPTLDSHSNSNSGGAITFRQLGAPLASAVVNFVAGSDILGYGSSAAATPSLALTLANANTLNDVHFFNNGSGDAGSLSLSSGTNVTISGSLDTHSAGGNGGAVTVDSSAGALTITGPVNASSSAAGSGGTVTLSSTANLSTGKVTTSSSGGSAGGVSILSGGSLGAADIIAKASGGGTGGSILLERGAGATTFTLGSLDSSSSGASAGDLIFRQSGVVLANATVNFAAGSYINLSGKSAGTTSSLSVTLANPNILGTVSTVNSGTGTSGAISITLPVGDFQINQPVSGGAVSLVAPAGRLLAAATITASGGATLTARDDLTAQAITATNGDIRGTSTIGQVTVSSGAALSSDRSIVLSGNTGVVIGDGVTMSAGVLAGGTPATGVLSSANILSPGSITITSNAGIDINSLLVSPTRLTSNGGDIVITALGGNLSLSDKVAGAGGFSYAVNGGNIQILSSGALIAGGTNNSFLARSLGTIASFTGGGMEFGSGLTSSNALATYFAARDPNFNSPAAGAIGPNVIIDGNSLSGLVWDNTTGGGTINVGSLNPLAPTRINMSAGAVLFQAQGAAASIDMDPDFTTFSFSFTIPIPIPPPLTPTSQNAILSVASLVPPPVVAITAPSTASAGAPAAASSTILPTDTISVSAQIPVGIVTSGTRPPESLAYMATGEYAVVTSACSGFAVGKDGSVTAEVGTVIRNDSESGLDLQQGKLVVVPGRNKDVHLRTAQGEVIVPASGAAIVEQTAKVVRVSNMGNGSARLTMISRGKSYNIEIGPGQGMAVSDSDVADEEFIPVDGVDRVAVSATIQIQGKKVFKHTFNLEQMQRLSLLSKCSSYGTLRKTKKSTTSEDQSQSLQGKLRSSIDASTAPANQHKSSATASYSAVSYSVSRPNFDVEFVDSSHMRLSKSSDARCTLEQEEQLTVRHGEVLVESRHSCVVTAASSKIYLKPGNAVLVTVRDGIAAVRVLTANAEEGVCVAVDTRPRFSLALGQEVVVSGSNNLKSEVLKLDNVARRRCVYFDTRPNRFAICEYSFISLVSASKVLQGLMSNSQRAVGLTGRILKSAAAYSTITARHGTFSRP